MDLVQWIRADRRVAFAELVPLDRLHVYLPAAPKPVERELLEPVASILLLKRKPLFRLEQPFV